MSYQRLPRDDVESLESAQSKEDKEERKSKGQPDRLLLPLLVLAWYCTAAVSIVSSKTILTAFPFPFTLCTSQFVMGAIVSGTISSCMRSRSSSSAKRATVSSGVASPTEGRATPSLLVALISISYTLGFIFTNISFSIVNVAFAETVKAAEPISSVLIGLYVLHETNKRSTYLSLIPICAGISISCKGEFDFVFSGFAFALMSNFCFSYRAVMSKHLFKTHSIPQGEVGLFFYISTIGLLLLVPCCGYLEGTKAIEMLLLDAGLLRFVVPLFLLNGLAYATYNIMSIFVLARSDLVTHAVLNAFRRVFIIVVSSAYFGIRVTALNIVGMCIAILGVVAFALSKAGVL